MTRLNDGQVCDSKIMSKGNILSESRLKGKDERKCEGNYEGKHENKETSKHMVNTGSRGGRSLVPSALQIDRYLS